MVSTCRPSTITPVHRSCSRPPSDTRYSLSRVDSPSSATACPEGSTGRSRLCRRSKRSRTRHGPHERTLEPKAHARPSMWRPCSPDGEVCIGNAYSSGRERLTCMAHRQRAHGEDEGQGSHRGRGSQTGVRRASGERPNPLPLRNPALSAIAGPRPTTSTDEGRRQAPQQLTGAGVTT